MIKAVFLVVFLAPWLTTSMVRADTKEEARKHFDRAVELVDDGQLEGALVEFQRSYDLTQHFVVLYNIGQVLVSLARPVEAFDAYQRYLAEGRAQIPPARRIEVEKEMKRQKARIATLEIRGLPGGATVRVDGKDVAGAALAGPLRVGVGKHAITAEAEGYAPVSHEVTVAGEDHKVVNLVLAKAPTATLPAAPPSPPAVPVPTSAPAAAGPLAVATVAETAPPPMSKLRIAGIVIGAVGVAGLATGVGFWFLARDRHDDALKVNDSDRPRAESLQSDAKNYITATNISLVAGGTLAALGVAAFFLGTPVRSAPAAGAQAFVLPSVGPGMAGLGAGGIW